MRKLREGVRGPCQTRTMLSLPRKDPDHCDSAAHDPDLGVTLPAVLPLAGGALWSLFGVQDRSTLGQKQTLEAKPQMTKTLDFGLGGQLGRVVPLS